MATARPLDIEERQIGVDRALPGAENISPLSSDDLPDKLAAVPGSADDLPDRNIGLSERLIAELVASRRRNPSY